MVLATAIIHLHRKVEAMINIEVAAVVIITNHPAKINTVIEIVFIIRVQKVAVAVAVIVMEAVQQVASNNFYHIFL